MLRRLSLTALVLVLASCSGDSTGPEPEPGPSVEGTYELQSVNGSQLPVVLSTNPSIVVTSGTLTLEEDGRFLHTIRFDGIPDLEGTGAWATGAGSLTLTYDDTQFGQESGTLNGDQITVLSGNIELLYAR